MNCSWTFVHEPARLTFHELFVNCSWTIFGFIVSSWIVHELMMNCSWTFIHCTNNVNFSGTIDELFMNYFCFITSSWTVHELWWWTVHEFWYMNQQCEYFMNFSWTVHECSWTVHKVVNYISPGSFGDIIIVFYGIVWNWEIKATYYSEWWSWPCRYDNVYWYGQWISVNNIWSCFQNWHNNINTSYLTCTHHGFVWI